MKVHKYDAVKKQFPKILKDCLGIVTTACERANVSREWYYRQLKADPTFKQECDDVNEVVIDFVESHLYKQIKDNNPTSTIFFLKTKAKHRGYVERFETTGKDGGAIKNEMTLTGFDAELFERAREDDRAKAIAEYKAAERLEVN